MRTTFSRIDLVQHRLKATALMLGISENTLRSTIKERGVEVRRATEDNPTSTAARIFDLPTIFDLAAFRQDRKSREGPPCDPVVVAIGVTRGGTGKSTCAVEIGTQIQLAGLRVLIIDLDLQSSATQLLGYESDLEPSEEERWELASDAIVTQTFDDVVKPIFENSNQDWSSLRSGVIKRPFGANGPSLIPSDSYLGDLETRLASTTMSRHTIFNKLFDQSKAGKTGLFDLGQYDVVFLDCARSLSLVATNALNAADIVLAPVSMEEHCLKGVRRLVKEVTSINRDYKSPRLMILPTFYSKNLGRVSRMVANIGRYSKYLMRSSISTSDDFRKSMEDYLPLSVRSPNIESVKEYRIASQALMAAISQVRETRMEMSRDRNAPN